MTVKALLENSVRLEFVLSMPCSLVSFVDILAERPHTTTWVRDWYYRHTSSERELDEKIIADYRDLLKDSAAVHRDEIGSPLTLGERIVSIAATCETRDELLEKINTILTADEVQRLGRILEYFAPIYESLVWEPRLKELRKQIATAQRLLVPTEFDRKLHAVKKFMRAPWVAELPLVVCFIPLPMPDIQDPRRHGNCLGRVQLVELLPGKKAKQVQLDVVFHEACHALWETRPDKEETVKSDFEKLDGAFAYSELNEGMATALAQGWFYKLAFGRRKRKWYLDEIVDGYAKGLLDLLSSYVDYEREMDEEFARQATEIFKKRFPRLKERARPIQ